MSSEPLPMRPFSASLPMALLLAREATMRRFRPSLAEHGLTEQQWRVLRALASADQPIEVSVLAERTALLAPSVTRIVARLADDGMIRRDTVVGDARRSTRSRHSTSCGSRPTSTASSAKTTARRR